MGQIASAFIIALSLLLTGYYGLAAWRASDADRAAITGALQTRN